MSMDNPNQGDDRGGRGGRGGGGGARGERSGGGGGGRRGGFRRKRVCKFRTEKIDYVDYKDVRMLSQFVPERGKIQPRRLTGTSAKYQRKLQVAIKRARFLALLPYATD
ncbi:30S ribosomal protein S18 [Luteitalea pratensis]|uniref:Small ribosomal subunit protein bS18 n=2 Tax=Luteitalea pratensis TaxID=1855912 RepID=A0A143PU91_LUTPR|nr:30S ribosomal protein S18 [Luteitalea pratensis]